jgi:hypothetical protein
MNLTKEQLAQVPTHREPNWQLIALNRASLVIDALALCERLSDQQAMPDDSWMAEAKRIRDALNA